MPDLYEHHHNQMLLDEQHGDLLRLVEAVERAVCDLDPFNQGGATTHPEHGHEVGNDEASRANLDKALRDLRAYAEAHS